MKTTPAILLVCLSLVSALQAQDGPPPVPVPQPNVNPNNPRPPRPRSPQERDPFAQAEGLEMNHALRLHGSFVKDLPVDVTLQGKGPIFYATIPDPIVTFEATVHKQEAGYQMNYQIGFRLKITEGNNTSYRDSNLRGTVLMKPGEPVNISTVGENKLFLTFTPVKPEGK